MAILSEREKRRRFEASEVYKRNELKKIKATGYEAYRVSPSKTVKFGKQYRKIYGAVVEPDYSRPTGRKNKYGNFVKFYPKVTWTQHGYTSASIKGGTRVLMPLRDYPIEQKEARRKLMIRRRK
jgi:hypothetical protein